MANILVTGGAGYIGSTLVPMLLNEGHNVTVLDNFMYGQSSLNQLCYNKQFNVYSGDVRLKHDLFPLLKQADIVIPLAAYVGVPLCNKDPIGATTTNKDAIFMMIDYLSKEQLVIMPTTNSAYGTGAYCVFRPLLASRAKFCNVDTFFLLESYAIPVISNEMRGT
jgi:nucleoside-diphosphate-sugar epimerase